MTPSGHWSEYDFPMTAANNIQWKRLSIEAFAIVISILLAFAIDAWWENSKTAEDEFESLELIRRDLRETQAQLQSYSDYVEGAYQSALNAYAALSGDGPYDREYVRSEMIRVDRITLRIPTAAYTEILSTGNLRVISDRSLRDSIVRFYENAERIELVLQKNNDAFLDGLLMDSYYGDGLLVPHILADVGDDDLNKANELIDKRLGEDFVHQADPLWQYSQDSPEWNRLRTALLYAAQIHIIGLISADQMINEAVVLSESIQEWLDTAD